MNTFTGHCTLCDQTHHFTETTPVCDYEVRCACADPTTFTAHCPSGDTQLVMGQDWRWDTWRNETGSITRFTHLPTGAFMTQEVTPAPDCPQRTDVWQRGPYGVGG